MTDKTGTVACTHCGALNGGEFDRCIRCNEPLRGAAPADKAVKRVPAPRRRNIRTGPGAEPLLGRFPAEMLPAAKLMVALNVVVFAAHLLTAFGSNPSLDTLLTGGSPLDALLFGALPVGEIAGMQPLDPLVVRAEPWRMLSACFVHFGILHVGMNMLGLIWLARLAEPAIGSVRFIIMYTLSGFIGFASTMAVFFISPTPTWTAGASGAVFGVMGMVLGFLARRRDPRWKTWLGQAVIYSLMFTFMIPNVNHSAHIGGMLAGVALGALFAPGAPKPSRPWQRWLAGACVLAILGSLIAARMSPYYDKAVQIAQASG